MSKAHVASTFAAPDVHEQLRRERRRARLRENRAAYLFLLPNLVFFAGFMLIPVGWVVRQSFMEGGILGPARWVGLDNWSDALSEGEALASLANTGLYTAMTVPLLFLLAMVAALAVREVRRGGAPIRAILYLPALAPFVLAALVWAFMVHPEFGLLNLGTRLTGGQPQNWLGNQSLALPTLAMLEIWRGVGFWALFLLAGLLAIPKDLYAAASLDGASALRRFCHVTLPALGPTLVTAMVLSTLFAIQVFESPFVLTQGGPAGATETTVFFVYQSMFERAEPGLGAAVSVLLLLIVLMLTAMVFLVSRGRRSRGRPI